MKKILLSIAMLISLMILFFALGTTASAETYGDLTYEVSNGEITITDCNESATEVEIPAEINGYSVKCIGKQAFFECRTLEKIIIPDSIEIIDEEAFARCSSLVNVVIPDSVRMLSYGVFSCSGLKSIEIPDSVVIICAAIFEQCHKLESVTLPDGITEIAGFMFWDCSLLKNIEIPDGVTIIGDNAFGYCSLLDDITLPGTLRTIDRFAFQNSGLKKIDIPEKVETIGEYAFMNCFSLESVVITGPVNEIEQYAFCNCILLKNVTISEGVKNFGSVVFGKCPLLKSVIIPDGVENIGDYAFGYYDDGLIESFVIYGVADSLAESYANKNGITFVAIAPDQTIIIGDANGDGKITAADARIVLRISARLDKIENYNLPIEAFDATGDGKLTAADARKILRVAAKIDTLDNNESVVPAADFERLKEILLQTLNEPFDYKNNDAEYIVEHVLYDDEWAFGYQIYSDEILILYDNYWGNDDPDPYGRFGCYFILDAETVKWICEEIYHVECNETEYNSDNSYFYNGKLYLGCSGPVGLDGGLWVDLNSYTVNPEGKYEIIAKKYYESNLIGTYSILAEWTEIDGEYLWTFYSIEKI